MDDYYTDNRPARILCENCGEEYAATYRSCPFCESEEEERKSSGRSGSRSTGRKGSKSGARTRTNTRGGGYGGAKSPLSIIGIIVSIVLILAMIIIMITLIRSVFSSGSKSKGSTATSTQSSAAEETDDSDEDTTLIIAPDGLTMDLTELTLEANGTATLTATVDPEGWVGQLIWSTSDSTVATVNQSGVVTWVGEGTCTITASASGVLATCTVTCEAEEVEVVSDLIVRSYGNETSDVTLKVGESVTFTVEGGDGVNYTWSVEDSSIATIGSASGTCVGVSEGKTVVTVTSGDMTAEVVVRIAAAN